MCVLRQAYRSEADVNEKYGVKVESKNPASFSSAILSELNSALQSPGHASLSSLKAVPTQRGLDHGVFVPLKVAFAPSSTKDSQSTSAMSRQWAELKSACGECQPKTALTWDSKGIRVGRVGWVFKCPMEPFLPCVSVRVC